MDCTITVRGQSVPVQLVGAAFTLAIIVPQQQMALLSQIARNSLQWLGSRNTGCVAAAMGTGSVGGAALGLVTGPGSVITSPAGFVGGATVGLVGGLAMCSSSSGGGGRGGENATTSSEERKFWKDLKPFRGKTKTNGLTGKTRRFYEWDHTHNDIEVYDSRGNHLGSADPKTGNMTKPAVPGRRINL